MPHEQNLPIAGCLHNPIVKEEVEQSYGQDTMLIDPWLYVIFDNYDAREGIGYLRERTHLLQALRGVGDCECRLNVPPPHPAVDDKIHLKALVNLRSAITCLTYLRYSEIRS